MTRTEYDNTVRDLLGDTTRPGAGFAPEELQLGFDDQAAALTVSSLLADQYLVAAEGIAARATDQLEALLGCSPKVDGEDACAAKFVRSFLGRAFRRPADDGAVARYLKLYASSKKDHDFTTAIQLVIEAALQSPHFLYRVEIYGTQPVAPNVVKLDDWETASRLSYLLWNSMPDDDLFNAAKAGQLETAAQIAAQAERMLDDPRAHDAVANFHAQWLGLTGMEAITKDPSVYPEFNPDLIPLWRQETEAFVDDVVFDGPGDLATLLTAPYSMMNADLASFYGVHGPKSAAFERVDLDPSERSGFLTQASLMALYAKPNQSSPIHRGKFVREQLLCQTLPPPPANIVITPPVVKPGVSTRERFIEHSAKSFCAQCHHLMDPIGFGFEHYDAVGLFRNRDQGMPVDASGEIYDSVDADGPFDGVVELGKRLAGSNQVRQCFATEWFRFGYGRAEGPDDACRLAQFEKAFSASGNNVKSLLVALTQTDAFRYRAR